jgi:hypothetical protein
MYGDASDWWIVEVDSRGEGVVLLNYEGDAAHEMSARYAAKATEVDLTSDFNPGAHFFGEFRLPRTSQPPS